MYDKYTNFHSKKLLFIISLHVNTTLYNHFKKGSQTSSIETIAPHAAEKTTQNEPHTQHNPSKTNYRPDDYLHLREKVHVMHPTAYTPIT